MQDPALTYETFLSSLDGEHVELLTKYKYFVHNTAQNQSLAPTGAIQSVEIKEVFSMQPHNNSIFKNLHPGL